jgi:hypothetical protein
LANTANSNKQKSHSQWKLTQKTMFQAKHTNKNADHLEAVEAADADSAEAADTAEETDVAAADTVVAEAVTAADAIEAIDAVAAAAAVIDQDTKLSIC